MTYLYDTKNLDAALAETEQLAKLPESQGGAGWEAGKANWQAGMGALAGALGADTEDFVRRKQAEAEFYQRNAPGATQFMGEGGVTDGGSLKDWLVYNAASSLPYMLETAAGAGVGALALKGVRGLSMANAAARSLGKDAIETQVARATLEKGLTAQAERIATEQALKDVAARYAMGTGAAVAAYPSAVGDILTNQLEAGAQFKDMQLGPALAGGVPYAALNLLGGEAAVGRALTGGLTRKAAADTAGHSLAGSAADYIKATARGETLPGAVLRAGTRAGLMEGLGETGQEAINQYAGRMAVNPNLTMTSGDAPLRYAESFLAGFGLGAIPGGASSVFAKPISASPDDISMRKADVRDSVSQILAGNTSWREGVERTAKEAQDAQAAQMKALEDAQNAQYESDFSNMAAEEETRARLAMMLEKLKQQKLKTSLEASKLQRDISATITPENPQADWIQASGVKAPMEPQPASAISNIPKSAEESAQVFETQGGATDADIFARQLESAVQTWRQEQGMAPYAGAPLATLRRRAVQVANAPVEERQSLIATVKAPENRSFVDNSIGRVVDDVVGKQYVERPSFELTPQESQAAQAELDFTPTDMAVERAAYNKTYDDYLRAVAIGDTASANTIVNEAKTRFAETGPQIAQEIVDASGAPSPQLELFTERVAGKRPSRAKPKIAAPTVQEVTNAVQEPSPAAVDVQSKTRPRKEVGERRTKSQNITQESQTQKEQVNGPQATQTQQAEPQQQEASEAPLLTAPDPATQKWMDRHAKNTHSLAGPYPAQGSVTQRLQWLESAVQVTQGRVTTSDENGVVKKIAAPESAYKHLSIPGVDVSRTKEQVLADMNSKIRDASKIASKRRQVIDTTDETAKPETVSDARVVKAIGEAEPGVDYGYEGDEGVDFSSSSTHGGQTLTTVQQVFSALREWFITPEALAKRVTVVGSASELPQSIRARVEALESFRGWGRVQGFVSGGKAYLIAGNIREGNERAVFMHEIGSHLGFDAATTNTLAAQTSSWATAPEGSIERRVFDAAQERLQNAETTHTSEQLAYVVEEAVKAGVKPLRMSKVMRAGDIRSVQDLLTFVAQYWRAAIDSLFGPVTRPLTAQDLIELTYAAARKALDTPEVTTDTAISASKKTVLDTLSHAAFAHHLADVTGDPETIARVMELREVPSNTRHAMMREALRQRNLPEDTSTQEVLFSQTGDLPPKVQQYVGESGVQLWANAKNMARKAVMELTPLPSLVRRFEDRLPAIRKLYDAMLAAQTRKIELDQAAEKVLNRISNAELSPERTKVVEQFIMDSTTEQKWGYDPLFGRGSVVDKVFKDRFDALAPDEQGIVKDIFQHGEDTMRLKRQVFESLGIADPFKRLTQLPGPYAPLRRFGAYMVEVKSPALVAEEAAQRAEDGSFRDTKKIDALKSDPDNYMISFRDTAGGAQVLYNRLMATGRYVKDKSYVGPRAEAAYKPNEISRSALTKVLSEVKGDTALDDDVRTKMADTIKALYHSMMEDHLARQSMRERKNRAGADTNMFKAFAKQAQADAAFLANMEHTQAINEAVYEVGNPRETLAKEQGLQDVVNTLFQHRKHMLEYKDTPVQDAFVAATSVMQLATSPGYHFANATQVAMKTQPMLAAEFGDYGGAWKHVVDGYKVFRKLRGLDFDLSAIQNKGLRQTLELAAKMNLLDVGMADDFNVHATPNTEFGAVDAGLTQGRKVLHKLRQVSRWVERMNRIAAATAAYNMAIEHERNEDNARSFAIRVLEDTQGDFSPLASPLILKKLPKVLTQYRKYQIMVAGLYGRAMYDTFKGASVEERAIARRMLGFSLAHTAMVGGMLGLPLMNLAEMIIPSLFGDDDEPKDLERMVRDWFQDDTMADFVLKGPVHSLLGIDLGAKLSDDKVFAIAPYVDLDVSKSGLANALVGLMGPSMGQASKMIDGVALMRTGETAQGLSKLLPKGLGDAVKAYQLANKGVVLRNGDVLVQSEDISAYQTTLQGLGMPSAEINRYRWVQGQQIEIRKFYRDRETQLKKDYVDAWKSGDRAEVADLRDKWLSLQDRKENLRRYFKTVPPELREHPLGALVSAPNVQSKREQSRQDIFPDQ